MNQDWAIASANFHDASQFAEALTQTDIACIQTSRGPILLEATLAKLARLGVHFTAIPVGSCAAMGQSAPDALSFHIPLSPPHCLSIMGQQMTSDSIAVYSPTSEVAVRAQSGARLVYLVAAPQLLHSPAFATPDSKTWGSNFKTGIQSGHRDVLGRLRRSLEELASVCARSPDAFEHPEAIKNIKYMILEHLTGATAGNCDVEPHSGRTPVCRSHILAVIDNYLRACGNDPVYVVDLCNAAGVSQPTLFRTFEELFEMSPKQFLQMRRLHQVRRKLLDGKTEKSISSVAYDHGFWQLSRFGRAYKSLFGETPSATLRARSKLARSLLYGRWPSGSLGDIWIRRAIEPCDFD